MAFCTACGTAADPEDRYCSQCGRGVSLAARASPPEAARADRQPRSDLERGVLALAAGDPASAVPVLESLVDADPGHAIGRAYLGLAYLRLARAAEARTQLERSIRLAPQSFICHAKYAEFLANLGFYDQAVAELDTALACGPPDLESRMAALEMKNFCREKAKGIYYRQAAYPRISMSWLRRLLPATRQAPVRNGEG